MPIAHLYQIINKTTGEFYTGVHHGHKQDGYWGSGIKIKRAVKKYGKENFEYNIHAWGDTKDIYELEAAIANEYEINNNPLCMNLKVGGQGGTIPSEETKIKLRNKRHTPETKAKISASNKGVSRPRAERIYMLRNPEGQIVEIIGIAGLKKIGSYHPLSQVARGLKKSYKGWSKP